MNRHLRIFLAGVMIVVPFAATVWLILWVGKTLDAMVGDIVAPDAPEGKPWLFHGAGVLIVLAGMYLIGLLTHFWAFRWIVSLLERLFSRVPVVKSIYESLRDVLKLFSGEAEKMGQVVLFRVPGTEAKMLGIRTSTAPRGVGADGRVAVYLPMSYQFGGFTLYVAPEAIEPIDMSVEEALKIAATADVGAAEVEDTT